MSKRVRAITLCCLTVLCCIAIVVAATFALFSDQVQVTNHLQSGSLKVTLAREGLVSTMLAADGTLNTVTDNTKKEFTNGSTDNIFGLDDALIVPGCEVTANFILENKGDVAVGFYLEFVLKGETATETEAANKLAEQLQVTLSIGSNQQTFTLSELRDKLNNVYAWGDASTPIGRILLKTDGTAATKSFSVKLEFVNITTDETTNNQAQNQSVSVDMIVHAIQITE